jgi:iron complex transport system substrate-binding protein
MQRSGLAHDSVTEQGQRLRVLSLLASGTEICCALGAGDWLVGRSHECDNPEWVRELPACSAPAFDVSGPSGEIDAEVTRRVRAGEPLYVVDNALIETLHPDLVIAQAHCEVCAVTPGDVERASCGLGGAMQVMALTAGTLEGVFAGMERVATALGLKDRGLALIEAEKARLERVRERCALHTAKSVVLLEWTDPIFAMGNWGPELVEAANGRLLIGNVGEHSRAIAWDLVRAADPEVLVVAPCGFGLERALSERGNLENLPGWAEMRAVRSGRVAYGDGNLYFNRSGMTTVRTAEILGEMLHGEVFGERSEGASWQWVSA